LRADVGEAGEEVIMTTTTTQLDSLLKYLKKYHPIPKPSNLLVTYEEVKSFPAATPGVPTFTETSGKFYPNVLTKKLAYTGWIIVATQSDDPLNTLAHEYRHAMQFAEALFAEETRWAMEGDAIVFARMIISKFLASKYATPDEA
jgi:hypothetical protein